MMKQLKNILEILQELIFNKMELFKKVYVNSDTDLPKDGLYIAHYKMYKTDSPAGTILSQYDHLNSHKKQNWLERIDWYLQPVSLPDKDAIIEKLNELNKLRKSYIVFLGEQLSDNAAFLKAHGIVCSETDFKIGAEYRKQIEHFELELANLKKQ